MKLELKELAMTLAGAALGTTGVLSGFVDRSKAMPIVLFVMVLMAVLMFVARYIRRRIPGALDEFQLPKGAAAELSAASPKQRKALRCIELTMWFLFGSNSAMILFAIFSP